MRNGCLSPIFFIPALEYVIRKVQGNPKGLILNRAHQRIFESNYVNFMSENVNTTKKKVFGLVVNAEEISICSCLVDRMLDKITT